RDKLVTGVQTCALPISQTQYHPPLVRGLYRKERTDHGRQPARVVFTVVPKREKSLRVAEESPSSTSARPQKLLDRVRWHLRVKQIGRASCRERVWTSVE